METETTKRAVRPAIVTQGWQHALSEVSCPALKGGYIE